MTCRTNRRLPATIALAWLALSSMAPAQVASPHPPIPKALQSPGMMFAGIEVPDMDQAQAYYVRTLGLKVVLEIGRPGAPVHEVGLNFSGDPTSSEAMFFLVHHANATADQNHAMGAKVAFRVEDVKAVVARVRAAGYAVIRDVQPVPGQDIAVAMLHDPNGILVEVLQMGPGGN